MKKWVLFFVFVVSGCEESAPPIEQMKSSNGWIVELCFEKEGYKVYRFSDKNSEWRYYVVPAGEMIDHVTKTDDESNKTYPRNTRTVR